MSSCIALSAAQDSWEVKPDGNVAMLGRSLKGDYVFEQQGGGLIRAAGNDAPHYKVRVRPLACLARPRRR